LGELHILLSIQIPASLKTSFPYEAYSQDKQSPEVLLEQVLQSFPVQAVHTVAMINVLVGQFFTQILPSPK